MTTLPPAPAAHLTAAQIRQQFIDFFAERAGHTVVPSSPVIPHDDPTLLFANAGMNQFKPLFLGTAAPGSALGALKRAVNTQKCIRAGGKHNDLDDVGRDTYHHTFFEMLGNWSFGDYFKGEAIQWAWELLTGIWDIDPERLYATYFEGDKSLGLEPDREAYELWSRYLPASRILPGNSKDNFWEMGDTGPCGPCSELHYDGRSEEERAKLPGYQLVNRDSPDVIEIWNLVFIQFNRTERGLSPLPAKHVDTGMGFERLVRVLHGKSSNYDTDVFTPIFHTIHQLAGGDPYRGRLTDARDIAYRVLADHIRCLTFAISDGADPSNDGRGYVLRRILRRAVRMGRQNLGIEKPFLAKLAPTVVQTMGGVFPEIAQRVDHLKRVLTEEEESFRRTLDKGIELFSDAASRGAGAAISGEDAFKLHDTYGFPIDLTRVMAEERGMGVDLEGFERLMEEARQLARSGGKTDETAHLELGTEELAKLRHLNVRPTDDSAKYLSRPQRAHLKAIWNGYDFDQRLSSSTAKPTDRVTLIFDKTNFYSESGGQHADTGRAAVHRAVRGAGAHFGEFIVESTRDCGGYIAHIGRLLKGDLDVGDEVELRVDRPRRASTAANHTATHLLNHALRAVLGDHVQQKGSLVTDERLRFDFSHDRATTPEELHRVERRVNGAIEADQEVFAELAPLEQAKGIHAVRAMFGESYPDPVRVVSVGVAVPTLLADPENETWRDHAIEFCGGTHLERTSQAQVFVLTGEESVSKGVRRLVACTGARAEALLGDADAMAERISGAASLSDRHLPGEVKAIRQELESAELPLTRKPALRTSLAALEARVKEISKASTGAAREQAVDTARLIADGAMADQLAIVGVVPAGGDRGALMAAMDTLTARRPEAAVLLLSVDEAAGKIAMAAKVPPALIERGLKAGDWIKATAQFCDGQGGGKPDSAQGGGNDPTKISEAERGAREHAQRIVG
ncbi:MAG: alanine--tRNA ligase [Phycisphaerales bacterium]